MSTNAPKGPDGRIPKSLEKLLRVDGPSSQPATSAVPPSSLLAKLGAFLPQLEAANAALSRADCGKLNSIPAPVAAPVADAADAGGGSPPVAKDGDPLAVHMDVYVDEALGELVPSAKAAQETDKADAERGPPLVEEVADGK